MGAINLTKSNDSMLMSVPEEKKQDPRGPSFYVSGIELPLEDDDLNEEMTATVKIKPRRISKEITNGKEDFSYDLEVLSIDFKEGTGDAE